MQHRIQVGPHFYSVTVIREDGGAWIAMAEVPGGWLVRNGLTRDGALHDWRAAAETARQSGAGQSAPPPTATLPKRARSPQ